ncbi:MAG: hypothetical protein JXR95_05310 [Deltaproteobacteria bacterium]|nr:hypothetical protein [Deltaproteobacteria bacterium]
MIKFSYLFLFITSGLIISCSSSNGSDGNSSLVSVTTEAPGANCTYGGQKIETGIDDNADGILDTTEVDNTTYVCNGTDGTNTSSPLVSVTTEAPGTNCTYGGQKIETGIDDNADGILDATEVDNTTYVCNGTDGTDGNDGNDGLTSLVSVTTEAPDTNCTYGGQKIETGIDDNADGILDATEVDNTTYVCNGTDGTDGNDGLNSLVSVTTEASGTNCAFGGQKIETGIDDNADGILDATEVDNTSYVCNGTDGIDGNDGLTSLVSVTTEAPGTNCTYGGQKIETGIDDNADGILDATEVDNTSYVCNGTDGTDGNDGLTSLVSVTTEAWGTNCTYGGQKIETGIDR